MEESYCFLCQEPKSVVGHVTESCEKVKCKTCKQVGHTAKNCSKQNSKSDDNPKKNDSDEGISVSETLTRKNIDEISSVDLLLGKLKQWAAQKECLLEFDGL